MASDSDFLSPDDVANADFETKRRGYDPTAVRSHLTAAAATVTGLKAEINALNEKVDALRADVDRAKKTAVEAAQDPIELDEETLAARIGQDAARVLSEARAAAADRIAEAEDQAQEIIAQAEEVFAARSQEADQQASRIRQKAGLDAEQRAAAASVEAAEIVAEAEKDIEHARSLVSLDRESADVEASRIVREAETARRQILEDLARRRSAARRQIEQLRAGRERLLASHETVRRALDEITEELSISMSEARAAAETAGHSVSDTTIEELEAEIETARLSGLLDTGPVPVVRSPALPKSSSANVRPAAETAKPSERNEAADAQAAGEDEIIEAEAEAAVEEPVAALGGAESDRATAPDNTATAPDNVVELNSARQEVDTKNHPANRREPKKKPTIAEERTAPVVEEVKVEAEEVDDPADSVGDLFATLRSKEDAEAEATAAENAKKTAAAEAKKAAAKAKKSTAKKKPAKSKKSATVTDRGNVPELPKTNIDEVAAAALARRLKRVLADEQSRVMSSLRGADEVPTLESLLGATADHRSTYWTAVEGQVEDASSLPQEATSAIDELTDVIRRRVGSALEAAGADTEAAVGSMRSIYREIKTQQIGTTAEVVSSKQLANT